MFLNVRGLSRNLTDNEQILHFFAFSTIFGITFYYRCNTYNISSSTPLQFRLKFDYTKLSCFAWITSEYPEKEVNHKNRKNFDVLRFLSETNKSFYTRYRLTLFWYDKKHMTVHCNQGWPRSRILPLHLCSNNYQPISWRSPVSNK